MANPVALSRLLQLVSPMLPVGAYSYSQGLEWAIESGEVKDLDSATLWICEVLEIYQLRFELPVIKRLYLAWQQGDVDAIEEWDVFYHAGRDTAEALLETEQMGYSLRRLINELDALPTDFVTTVNALVEPSFVTLYAGLAQVWDISLEDALHGYAWAWLENQTSVVMKAVPLGQVAGQKILLSLGEVLPALIQQVAVIEDNEMSNFNPLLTIAGCQHETQYSRLFRS